MGLSPIVNEFVEAFAKRTMYFIGDFYSRDHQFQLAMQNKNLTIILTPLGIVRMCTSWQLYGVINAMKNRNEYLIGTTMIVETDCLSVLEMVISYSTLDITVLK